MEFAVPFWENRLSLFSADNSYPDRIRAGAFMMGYLWVALGGALGSVARYWASGFVASRFGETFPWGTILVNISGSFVIGFFAALTSTEGRFGLVPGWFRQQFFMLGVCGGYTTFSSFSLQTLNLVEEREWLYAGANVLLSVVCCLVAVWLGHALADTVNNRAS